MVPRKAVVTPIATIKNVRIDHEIRRMVTLLGQTLQIEITVLGIERLAIKHGIHNRRAKKKGREIEHIATSKEEIDRIIKINTILQVT